jgi:hypothetical protein
VVKRYHECDLWTVLIVFTSWPWDGEKAGPSRRVVDAYGGASSERELSFLTTAESDPGGEGV